MFNSAGFSGDGVAIYKWIWDGSTNGHDFDILEEDILTIDDLTLILVHVYANVHMFRDTVFISKERG